MLFLRLLLKSLFLSVVAMISYMTHIFDELIGSPSAKHFLAKVAYQFIQSLATSFAKPQPCGRPPRASRVGICTQYWQRTLYSCRYTLKTLLCQSYYMPTEPQSSCTRIEEGIVLAFDQFNISHLHQSLDQQNQHATVQRIEQRAVSIGTYEYLPLHSSYH